MFRPLFQDGLIYAPADSEKLPIRPLLSPQQIHELIDQLPALPAEGYHASTIQALTQRYQSAIRSHDCCTLAQILKSIYCKRLQAESQHRRLGMVDERYMKQAEQLLYGEISASLEISFEEVES